MVRRMRHRDVSSPPSSLRTIGVTGMIGPAACRSRAAPGDRRAARGPIGATRLLYAERAGVPFRRRRLETPQ